MIIINLSDRRAVSAIAEDSFNFYDTLSQITMPIIMIIGFFNCYI